MYEYGVIASPIGTAFEMAPPLIATKADLDETVRVASLAIDEISRERNLILATRSGMPARVEMVPFDVSGDSGRHHPY